MGTTVENTTKTFTIEGLTCGVCGVAFGLEVHYHQRMRNTGNVFYCPNGHNISYTETENARLKRKLEREEAARNQAERRRLEAERDAREWSDRSRNNQRLASRYRNDRNRIKARVEEGVCIHCNRSFQNLARHMKTKHSKKATKK